MSIEIYDRLIDFDKKLLYNINKENIKKKESVIMNREEFIMNRLWEHYFYLEEKGYEVVCLMLQGSQNYDLDEYSNEYTSDIDSKAIVLPHFKDFVYEKQPVSKVEILDNNEHIDVKDIRVMFDMFKKENISYIELLYTKYKIINPKYYYYMQKVFDHRKDIAEINVNQFLRCIVGMSGNKVKALCHPYPNLIEKIEKYGFDGKQLSHCVRLYEFLQRYCNGVALEKCYISEQREDLMNLKKQLTADGTRVMTQEEAVAACNFYYEQTKALETLHLMKEDKINYQTIAFLDKIKYDILKQKFEEDITDEQ